MRIQLDDKHVLCSDKYCCWVMKEAEKEDGSGSYEVRVTGYHRTFEELVENYIASEFMAAEAKNLQELAAVLTELKKEVQTWNKSKNGSK